MSATVVVITGASSGIGRELATNLAAKPNTKSGEPYKLVLLARREEELKSAVQECNKLAGKEVAAYYVADAAKKNEVDAAAEFAVKTFGRIDVWVNNAGRAVGKHVLDLEQKDVEDMMAVNVYSALWGMQAAVKVFKAQSPVQGQIINVSSLLGRNPALFPGGTAYNGAKHFLNALTDNLRQDMQAEEATKNITITLYSPGVVNTPFGQSSGTGDHSQIPYAQPVAEVGDGLRLCIEEKREEMYSRDSYKQMIVDYIANKA